MALALAGCRGGAVSPAPDADAAPAPIAGPDGSLMTPCQAACAALAAVGCVAPAGDCVRTLSRIDGDPGVEKEPNGSPLTCADVARVRSKAEAQALGICRGQ